MWLFPLDFQALMPTGRVKLAPCRGPGGPSQDQRLLFRSGEVGTWTTSPRRRTWGSSTGGLRGGIFRLDIIFLMIYRGCFVFMNASDLNPTSTGQLSSLLVLLVLCIICSLPHHPHVLGYSLHAIQNEEDTRM